MNYLIRRAAAFAMFFLFATAAQAGCVEDPRQVKFHENVVTRLKSYLCAPDDEPAAKIKVEFFQFSDAATSLIVGKVSSEGLKKTIGAPKLVDNEIAKIYADLLKRFGVRRSPKSEVGEVTIDFQLGPPQSADGGGMEDKLGQKTVRVLTDSLNREGSHPAYGDFVLLQKKQIPEGMHIYYSVPCLNLVDSEDGRSSSCKEFSPERATIDFWRGMRASDVKNYSKDTAAFNRLLGENVPSQVGAKISSEFEMLNHVTGGKWPNDFIVLKGSSSQDGCIASDGWIFNYAMRDIYTDMVLIQNMSSKPVAIGGLLGARSAETALRVQGAAMTGTGLADPMAETLAPGQRLLIPVKMAFLPGPGLGHDFSYPEAARKLYEERGTSGYKGNAPFGAPAFKNYVYGPEINATGVIVDGKPVSFPSGKEINEASLTISSGSGSCPFLLSWEDQERGWTDHGKVLHKGKGKGLEYSEAGKFEGLKTKFRLEEREPEIAHIDQAELVIALRNGDTRTLKPDLAKLAVRDGDYATLYWGEAIEFSFALPADVAEDEVVESRLTLTGYYERYSQLMAFDASMRPRPGWKILTGEGRSNP